MEKDNGDFIGGSETDCKKSGPMEGCGGSPTLCSKRKRIKQQRQLPLDDLVDVLYLDFAKAFDTVDHITLIEKLKWYGVTGQLLGWFSDHLSDRSQRVVIDGEASVRVYRSLPVYPRVALSAQSSL